ncbi:MULTISPECIES: hypothetical protein [Streptomyces]|uniref:Uncharacterized protein n=1 Tax=Streptomyces dengpaensis TaxID=2049881 RepID=A0ABN5ICV7_9ACTN|nr:MULTISPECIES: hypothetical protein [Streptomyces]AVH60819.1 hypothetical protein C4B68_39435 [Streptomyces dengpaensis]PIB03958.1 hypothetical protein B1C81_34895 [Streptomyces sp. HG99]
MGHPHPGLHGLKAGGGNEFRAYVNGKEYVGDPAVVEFRAHDEIALVYGPVGQKTDVPSSYDWPSSSARPWSAGRPSGMA